MVKRATENGCLETPARERADVLANGGAVGARFVLRFWLPLAVSWAFMTIGSPIVNAIIARTADAKLQLAAFGIGFSLVMAVQSPIVSLLTASVTLVRSRSSYYLLRRFMLGMVIALTTIMVLLGHTSLFDLVVRRLVGVPEEIAVLVRPVLWGLTPFPAAVAYRRFRQGVMIQYGYTREVSYGSATRLAVVVGLSLLGLMWGKLDGAVMGGIVMGTAISLEAILAHFLSRAAVCQVETLDDPPDDPPLTMPALLRFYWPLALTTMVWLLAPSLVNLGLARAPHPVESLAAWAVVNSQISFLSSFGFSYLEVVVALFQDRRSIITLRRFALALSTGALALLLLIAYTPLAPLWQQKVAGLNSELVSYAVPALRLAALLPVTAVLLSWLRGIVVAVKATGVIAQGAVIDLSVLLLALLIGAKGGWLPGASLAAVALTLSRLADVGWLWRRAWSAQRRILTRGEHQVSDASLCRTRT